MHVGIALHSLLTSVDKLVRKLELVLEPLALAKSCA